MCFGTDQWTGELSLNRLRVPALCLLLHATFAGAVTYPDLLTVDDILTNPEIADAYYALLKLRFRNGNFDEMLFLDDPSAASPRLSKLAYDQMLTTLRTYLSKHPSDLELLRRLPRGDAPFSIESGRTVTPSKHEIAEWSKIGEMLAGIQSANDGSSIEDLMRSFLGTKNEQTLSKMAAALICRVSDGIDLDLLKRSPPTHQYLVLESLERKARRAGQEANLPGKILDEFRKYSPFISIPRTDIFGKGTTVLPMSRLEAIFKGVGPGECVRTACHRYFDSLFDDAIHYRILIDGEESGHISILKTHESNRKYWFIESIQSPGLVKDQDPRKIRSLIRHLQQVAIQEGAELAIPSSSFNSYNFKEIPAALVTFPETHSNRSLLLEMDGGHASLDRFRTYSSQAFSAIDQEIVRGAGYTGTDLTNGFEFNSHRAVPVLPLVDQPDWYLIAADDLQKKPGFPPRINFSAKLTDEARGVIFARVTGGIPAKEYLFKLRQEALVSGDKGRAKRLARRLYNGIPEGLWDASFEEQLKFVKYRIDHIRQKAEYAQTLKDELYLRAETPNQYMQILDLGDRGDGREFSRFISSTWRTESQ